MTDDQSPLSEQEKLAIIVVGNKLGIAMSKLFEGHKLGVVLFAVTKFYAIACLRYTDGNETEALKLATDMLGDTLTVAKDYIK